MEGCLKEEESLSDPPPGHQRAGAGRRTLLAQRLDGGELVGAAGGWVWGLAEEFERALELQNVFIG